MQITKDTVVTLQYKVSDANGKLIAHGTTTCLIFPL